MTLENVIERILLSDIHDERDREEAINMLQRKATIMPAKDDDISSPTDNIFKHKHQVMQYYNNLIYDVQKTIDECQQANCLGDVKLGKEKSMRSMKGKDFELREFEKLRAFSA